MLLLVDVGNSTVKWRLSKIDKYKPIETGVLTFKKLVELKRFAHLPYKLVASVKPSLNKGLKEILKNPIFLNVKACEKIIKVNYKTPETLGVDRILNAIGGLEYGKSFVVVSFGTATVVDLVLNKTFEGGTIFLGFEKHAECLAKKGEQLKEFIPSEKPPLLGKSTQECISSGVFYNQLFTTKGFIKHFRDIYDVKKVICTGGLGKFFKDYLKCIYDKELIFKGMFKVFEMGI